MRQKILQMMFAALVCASTHAQVNSGSNGSDGAFNPTTNTVINMADHPNGIYQYTSVNISNGVTVTFIPNANNTPVTWLVQGDCEIDGTVDVSGQNANFLVGGAGGPGGWAGGSGGTVPAAGGGPGGGAPDSVDNTGNAGSFGTQGVGNTPSPTYGNSFLLPLIGGSGGGGEHYYEISAYGFTFSWFSGGGGGGGAILIASSSSIAINGTVSAVGGASGSGGGGDNDSSLNGGSGGAIRLVSAMLAGTGSLNVGGGGNSGGAGRIRIDAIQNTFAGNLNGVQSEGFQPIIIPVARQGIQLSIASVAGASVSATPTGQAVSPDAIISGQQANPIQVVVNCANLPLNTLITVTVTSANGSSVSTVGYNTAGTLASSTATVSLNMPRGGGLIYATTTTSN